MTALLNLAFPWLLVGTIAFLLPASHDPNFWMLQGLQDQLRIYGMVAPTAKLGIVGFFIPLAVLHNLTFVFVRFVQSRMDLDFLPMIKSVLGWVGLGLLGYWLWLSFIKGATFGEFHGLVLSVLPLLGLCVGLAFFVGRNKSTGNAQITAMIVAWAPLYSIVATLAGNHLRPPDLFSEVVVEPGGSAKGLGQIDSKTQTKGFIRLSVEKEAVSVQFPGLARQLQVEHNAAKVVTRISSQLDPIPTAELLKFPSTLELAGWRPTETNEKILTAFCAQGSGKISEVGKVLTWVKADAVLHVQVQQCTETAKWSMSAESAVFALGSLNKEKAQQIRERREVAGTPLNEVDQSLLSSADWRQRRLGYGLLAQVNDATVIPLLAKGFYDRDVEVRQTVATGLLSWGTRVEEFLNKALVDKDAFMRGDALRIVSLANRFKPHPAAIRMLSDSSDYVRVSAVQALGPFVRDNFVLKTLMGAFDREMQKSAPSPGSRDHFKNLFIVELVKVIASADDVRTAGTLLKAMPLILSSESLLPGAPEIEAARSLRSMKNWLGTDYLQAISRRSANLETRQKALTIMAHWRETGDEAVYIKALEDPALRPHAQTLSKFFNSIAVQQVVSRSATDVNAR
jgi:hypothetical protein